MSFVTTEPELMAAAAVDLAGVGLAMTVGNVAAAIPTTSVVPAASDEVSVLVAAQFAAHAQIYQAVSAQAAAVHDLLVATLGAGARKYAVTEAANAITTR
ncbi:PE family protein [Mycobacterium gordonae]|nr:PE family protein [Mycobacterium gordonae]OBJ87435.1 PE family protein [Mycobacterium gordonae]